MGVQAWTNRCAFGGDRLFMCNILGPYVLVHVPALYRCDPPVSAYGGSDSCLLTSCIAGYTSYFMQIVQNCRMLVAACHKISSLLGHEYLESLRLLLIGLHVVFLVAL